MGWARPAPGRRHDRGVPRDSLRGEGGYRSTLRSPGVGRSRHPHPRPLLRGPRRPPRSDAREEARSGPRRRSRNGLEIGFRRALLRSISRFLSFFLFGLGYWWAFWDPERQTWHDKISRTVVVPAD
ncbi:MAG TPA: RDD family protein [Actinomycetota bacterium]